MPRGFSSAGNMRGNQHPSTDDEEGKHRHLKKDSHQQCFWERSTIPGEEGGSDGAWKHLHILPTATLWERNIEKEEALFTSWGGGSRRDKQMEEKDSRRQNYREKKDGRG